MFDIGGFEDGAVSWFVLRRVGGLRKGEREKVERRGRRALMYWEEIRLEDMCGTCGKGGSGRWKVENEERYR